MHFSLNNLRGEKDIEEYFQKYKEIEEWKKADCIVYIINMYDENDKCVFTKIGKSKNILRRFQKRFLLRNSNHLNCFHTDFA